ncbi:MAG: quorum-sensing autoinducer synthase [Desulfobulbaceae bacterium]|nr:quorum-sensing autoinducer synthase [Desulfobulbaceae bacterium]
MNCARQQEPAFLADRVNAYVERSKNPISGGHFVKGRIPANDDIQLVSNDYLSISSHPEIAKANIESLRAYGHGHVNSAVFQKGDTPQRQFEIKAADWLSTEDSMLSQSGWCANAGLVQSLATPEVPVYLDMMAHMSLWEGVKSAGAKPRPFRHNNSKSLENLVKKYGQGVILVDSLYSTSGSICPLKEVANISSRYGCILVVDESHSLGVMGKQGAGLVDELGLADQVQFRTASLSKAFAARGGIIAGTARHIEYLRYESFPAIFSSAVLDHESAGFLAALEVIKKENNRRDDLNNNADFLRGQLRRLGYDVSESQSQIMSLVAGPEHQTIVLRDALEARGVFGSPFCAPATPKNRSLIRFSVNSGLTKEQLTRVVEVCREIKDIVQRENWPVAARVKQYQPAPRRRQPELSLAF